MSGSQIGTVIGGAIGYYFGGAAGAQIGMAIGGAVGGAIDPTKIYGPHIGDGQQQTAQDGVPIAWVQGRARIAGTIVDVSEVREVKKKDDGKGSGTEQVTYEAHQDFAILICESSLPKGTYVENILRIEQDGKIVYDADPTSPLAQDSAQFLEGVDFMYGGEDQMPHPTLEAVHGVGNTLAYRGYLVAVFRDFNISASGTRIPSFVFTIQAANVNGSTLVRYTDAFKYQETINDTPGAWIDPAFDDRLWMTGLGGFGTTLPGFVAKTPPKIPTDPRTFWLRKPYLAAEGTVTTVRVMVDDFAHLYWNGEDFGQLGSYGVFSWQIPANKVLKSNMAVVSGHDVTGGNIFLGIDIYPQGKPPSPIDDGLQNLATVVSNICLRGGLSQSDIDVSELQDYTVIGYPIATQSTATDCLTPLLSAYFCYASEYDGVLHFRKLGANATVTVNPKDLIESDTGSDGASVVSTSRNQETEYPKRITATYYDPDQNYQAVATTYERNSKDVNAIGEQTFQIPVVMTANDAFQAAVKALKATWAQLEGTKEYSVPWVGRGGEPYLSIASGDPIFFLGRRWLVQEMTLGHNMIHLKTNFDRQSSYTTNLQVIPQTPPIPPVSQVGGLTTLYAMNLPRLRPQDTYGLYLAVVGEKDAWAGATIQISYDNAQSWQTVLTATEASTMGTLTTAPGAAATSFGVQVKGDLETITSTQLAARGNPFAILSSADVAEVGQFRVATQTGAGAYTLTEAVRGQLGTTAAAHLVGDRFTMLDSVYFLPIDLAYGQTVVKLRAVTLGGKAEDAAVISILYAPDDEVILDGGGAPL